MQNETGDDYVCDGLSSVEDDPEGCIQRNPLGFSPILIRRDMRQLAQSQGLSTVNAAAAIYMASVLDYVCREILRLAGAKANANREGFARIVPRHIQTAIREDDELQRLLGQATIRSGGVLPNIHALLLPKQTIESAATSDASNVTVPVASNDLANDGLPNLHRTDEELNISAFDIRAASF